MLNAAEFARDLIKCFDTDKILDRGICRRIVITVVSSYDTYVIIVNEKRAVFENAFLSEIYIAFLSIAGDGTYLPFGTAFEFFGVFIIEIENEKRRRILEFKNDE